MMLYRNTKVKVRLNGDTDNFDIVAGVLQGDTLAPYFFIICLDYVIRTSIDKMKDNGFKLTKERTKRYPAHTITDAEYANDVALLANTPTPVETRLHSLEWAAAGIGLYVNADKSEYICFNQRGDISTLNSSSLKLVDKFTYQGSSVSSTETDINTRWAKAWTAIIWLLVLWKLDLTDKNETQFFSSSGHVDSAVWMHYMDANLTYGEKAWQQLRKNVASNIKHVLEAAPHKAATIWPLTTHHENYQS